MSEDDNKKAQAKEQLDEFVFTFESPISGETYQITRLGAVVADMRSKINHMLLALSPEVYAKQRAIYIGSVLAAGKSKKADVMVDALVGAFEALLVAQKLKGTEHKTVQRLRHSVGDLLGVMDSEAHATYHITKQPGGEDSKTVDTITAAAVFAYRRLLELSYAPGL